MDLTQFCLSHAYFLKNNIRKGDNSYTNESYHYYEKYNCAIVVPITQHSSSATELFGFLACDTLAVTTRLDSIMDFQMAEVMIATANIIGDFFKDMDYQWHTISDDPINETIFSMKKEKHKNKAKTLPKPKVSENKRKKKSTK